MKGGYLIQLIVVNWFLSDCCVNLVNGIGIGEENVIMTPYTMVTLSNEILIVSVFILKMLRSSRLIHSRCRRQLACKAMASSKVEICIQAIVDLVKS